MMADGGHRNIVEDCRHLPGQPDILVLMAHFYAGFVVPATKFRYSAAEERAVEIF